MDVSYGVQQIRDQLEKYANLERQKSQGAQGFRGKISAVGEKGCAVCLSLAIRTSGGDSLDRRPQMGALRLQNNSVQNGRKGKTPKNPQQDGARDADQHGRGKGKW